MPLTMDDQKQGSNTWTLKSASASLHMLQIMQDVTSLCVDFIKNLVKDSTTELHGFGSTPVYKQAQQATTGISI